MMDRAERAVREAENRIARWREGETLDLSVLPIAALPDSIRKLRNLESIDCSFTQVSDLAPLSGLKSLQSIDCFLTQVSDLAPLSGLKSLQSIDCSRTQVSDLAPLSGLKSLQSIDCYRTQVNDLAPLSGLKSLQSITCSRTHVNDLAPLSGLHSLQSIDCSGTPVSDLAPLSGLHSLQSIDCSGTPVSGLAPLSGLKSLRSITCSRTQVSDLAPLSGLKSLRSITCSRTQVSDLAPLSGLHSLQSIDCSDTQVSDLAPLSGLKSLRSITCSRTQVSDLAPLSGLHSLQSIDCSGTQVSDLAPLSGLRNLQSIDCDNCRVVSAPDEFWRLPSLTRVHAYGTTLPDVPAEVVSQFFVDNCLDRMRAHLNDIAAGAERLGDAKLMVLGNGRIGKTQIAERLQGRYYDPTIPSTHGITVSSIAAPHSADGDADGGRLHIWDFGGQDIYHGTHALFLRTRAIFAIGWTPGMEEEETHEHEGMIFRNYPLPYWIDYAARFGGTDSPVIVIQTQCDTDAQDALVPVEAYRRLEPFSIRSTLCYSARTNRNRATLDSAMAEAYARLPKPLIGKGRLTVKNRLEDLRNADMQRLPADRQNRTISHAAFEKMCAEAGNIFDPDAFLDFLHNAGTVFYRKGLFGDQLILDQSWALNAIYAVFNRQRCVRPIKANQGRFDRTLLGGLIWDADHAPKEQELFLSMMRSCGICFMHRWGDTERGIEAQYIAPDLLPEKQPPEAGQEWDPAEATLTSTFTYDLLTPALIRGIIAAVGESAGLSGEYWRDGVYVFESERRSRAFITRTMTGPWAGTITIRTQHGRAQDLLDVLSELVQRQEQRLGLSSQQQDTPRAQDRRHDDPETSPAPDSLAYERERTADQQWYVSYANSDNTAAEGAPVDRFCEAARAEDRAILRDTEELRHGDSIARFMDMLATGDRIFIFLTDAYLRSPYCMYELHRIREIAEGDATFMQRVRLCNIGDVPLSDSSQWFEWQDHWIDIIDRYEGRGMQKMSAEQISDYVAVRQFARETDRLLKLLASHVHAQSLEDLLANGLTDD